MQQHQKIADLLRNFMRDDGDGGHHADFNVGDKRGGDHHTVDEVVHGVADDDHHAAATVVVLRRLRVVRIALRFVAVTPQHEFFQHEEKQDAKEDGGGDRSRISGRAEGMRQDVEKDCGKQRADGKTDQHRNVRGARVEGKNRGDEHAQESSDYARRNDPKQNRHARIPVKRAEL